jgi:hypothetical protein
LKTAGCAAPPPFQPQIGIFSIPVAGLSAKTIQSHTREHWPLHNEKTVSDVATRALYLKFPMTPAGYYNDLNSFEGLEDRLID